jgi:hypothetical protein
MRRYELVHSFNGESWMDEYPDGGYVLYDDIKPLIENLEYRLSQTRCDGCEHTPCVKCEDDLETERILDDIRKSD